MKWKLTRDLGGAFGLLMMIALIGGCASSGKTSSFQAGDETMPIFLNGPAAVLLTNLDGFSAHLVMDVTSSSKAVRTVSGDVLGREGRLLFQPGSAAKPKPGKSAGLSFIWDTTRHRGFVLSDALQGYAPVPASTEIVTVAVNPRLSENINGRPCHRAEAMVGLGDGTTANLTVWQADDFKGFPVRMEWLNGSDQVTMNFTKIRLEPPRQELFFPPDAFTKYSSATVLMNELLIRQLTVLAKKPVPAATDEEFPDPGAGGTGYRGAGGAR